MGKPKGRARKKFGKRGPDGRAVSKKPKLALQHELPSGSGDAHFDGDDGAEFMDVDAEEEKAAADEDVNDEDWCEEDPSGAHSSGGGSGDAHFDGDDGAEFMDVDAEEEKAAADEDVNDEDWCEEDPSGAHSSGGGQSILRFAQKTMESAARAARNAAQNISPRKSARPPTLSASQKYRNKKKIFGKEAAGLARTMGARMQRARRGKEQEEEEESSSVGGEVGQVVNPAVDLEVAPHAGPPGGGSECADSRD
ncbi:unnamed protein product [Ectocarpus sp. CCAP 1310/34]|nr:unnamed protein product [Ectocarpus sp. CCAP 1310/34]